MPEQEKSKEYVYYIREMEYGINGSRAPVKGRPPVACVMFSVDPNNPDKCARGISICSRVDKWDYAKAKSIARGRLRKALGRRNSSDPIGVGEPARMSSVIFMTLWSGIVGINNSFFFKSAYGIMSAFERGIISRTNKALKGA